VRAVVATNALELASISASWMRLCWRLSGHDRQHPPADGPRGPPAGRGVGVLVATADAIDQYLIAHPEYVLERSPEHARLNPDNEVILAGHLACAAAELPFEADEHFGTPESPVRRKPTPRLARRPG